MYWKLLKNGGMGAKESGRVMEGVEWTHVKNTHKGDISRNPFEH
jgi:hypothetical protein